jgi:transcriptional regulator GlxA family with amidase domain
VSFSSWLCIGDHLHAEVGGALRQGTQYAFSLHEDLGRTWNIDELAGAANMSRSAFAARFKRRVGEAPIDYLTRWRMFRASCLLRQSQHAVGDIAGQVGYESQAAFSKAFKRFMGTAPGAHRRTQGSSGATAVQLCRASAA